MKKFILSTAVMLSLAVLAMKDAKAASDMNVTFQGGQQCVCRDLDHWTDAKKAGGVQVTCGTVTTFYPDTAVNSTTVKEYTCGKVSGSAAVVTDTLTGKTVVSSANIACAKGAAVQAAYPTDYPTWYVPYAKKKVALAVCAPKTLTTGGVLTDVSISK